MGFANPTALWGLLALVVPILVHLFDFRRSVTVQYSHVGLLKNLIQQQSSKRNIKKWILLCSRCLMILLLTLAFAKPYMGASPKLGKRESVGIFIDNSPSMSADGKEGPLLEMAKEAAREVIKGRPADTRYLIYSFGSSAPNLHLKSKEEALNAIDQISYSHISKPISQAIQKLKDALETAPLNGRKIFIFSDFQKSQWGNFKEIKDYRILCGILSAEEESNIFVDSAWFTSPLLQLNRPVSVAFTIRNEGDKKISDQNIRLKMGNQLVAAGKFTVDAKSEISDTLSFRPNQSGWQKFSIQIDDQPIEFDNQYHLTAEVNRATPILFIGSHQSEIFFKAALPQADGFNITSVTPGTIPYDRIQDFDGIFIQGMTEWTPGFLDALENTLKQGKTVAYFSNNNVKNESLLQKFGIQMGSTNNTVSNTEQVELADPIFQGVFEKVPQNVQWPVLKQWKSVMGNGVSLMKTQDGNSWLSRFSYQRGSLFICGADMRPEASDFVNNALFVPFIYQTALQSVAAPPSSIRLGQKNSIFLPILYRPQSPIQLTNETDTIIPVQSAFAGGTQFNFTHAPDQPGVYRCGKTFQLAFNTAPEESILAFPDAKDHEKLSQWNYKIFDIVEAKRGSLLSHSPPIKSTASKWMLCFALICIIIEWYYTRK